MRMVSEDRFLGGKDHHVRELVGQGSVDGLDVPGSHFVELGPLAKDPVVGQSRLDGLEILAGEEVGDSGYPRVGRLADDYVEGVLALAEEVAAIADSGLDLGVLKGAMVDVVEEAGGFVDGRLELYYLQAGYGVLRDGSCSYAGAVADQGDFGRVVVRVEQER